MFREEDETSSSENRFLLGAHTASSHPICLSAGLVCSLPADLLPAQTHQLTGSQESPHSSQGKGSFFSKKYFLSHIRVCLSNIMCIEVSMNRETVVLQVTQNDTPAVMTSPQKTIKVELKEELVCVPINCETPKAPPKRQASSSRRKQRLVHSAHEEPVLLCHDNNFFDSGVASDASTFQDNRDTELDGHRHGQESPDREFAFKTPIKGNSHLTSSTPSKPPSNVVLESWKVTPVGKGSQNILDFSPIRTPGGPTVTPRHDYTTFSFSSTPFKDLPLFSSPRELLTSAPSRAAGPAESPSRCLRSSCSRELLQAGGVTPANRSITEGLVLDTMNDSLSKILVDISFSGLDDDDLGMTNISWSEFIPQLK